MTMTCREHRTELRRDINGVLYCPACRRGDVREMLKSPVYVALLARVDDGLAQTAE